ncbi:Hypothetical predicted protein [Mytilus galloprovincialis]|uniref:VWFA domain-containing protein n=1 Tax=Mytilus galloprovincialis TaxID=29158 RepID=A0A8B6D2N9_MYTGA|nr:Hypothetical predicted protein [Mytilus galloprovincialis]
MFVVVVQCVVSEWTAWGHPDNQGTCIRTRRILIKPVSTGKPCPATTETKSVKRDCELGEWGQWTKPFGFGTIERIKQIKKEAFGGGAPCPVERQTKNAPITTTTTSENFGVQFVRPVVQPRDLVLLIDGSGSIGDEPFAKTLEDLSELIGMFCPLSDPLDHKQNPGNYIQLSAILFSTDSELVFKFNKYHSVKQAQHAIKAIHYNPGTTCKEKALMLGETMFTVSNGMRPSKAVKKEVLLLTDGLYNCEGDNIVLSAAQSLKNVADVYGMMIGISTDDGRQKLSKLVSEPQRDHLFAVDDLGQFSKLIIHLKDLIHAGKLNCVPFKGPLPH